MGSSLLLVDANSTVVELPEEPRPRPQANVTLVKRLSVRRKARSFAVCKIVQLDSFGPLPNTHEAVVKYLLLCHL